MIGSLVKLVENNLQILLTTNTIVCIITTSTNDNSRLISYIQERYCMMNLIMSVIISSGYGGVHTVDVQPFRESFTRSECIAISKEERAIVYDNVFYKGDKMRSLYNFRLSDSDYNSGSRITGVDFYCVTAK